MIKIVVIKLLFSCILMLNILFGQNKPEYHIIEKEIAEIREEFNNYYYNEKFNEALKVLQRYDNESVDDTMRIYVKILKAKTFYILGDIEDALNIVETIRCRLPNIKNGSFYWDVFLVRNMTGDLYGFTFFGHTY